jgi:hypothetical protein
MTKALAWTILALSAALTATACSANVAATDTCKSDAGSANECRTCCHANGASGYKYFSTCECLN